MIRSRIMPQTHPSHLVDRIARSGAAVHNLQKAVAETDEGDGKALKALLVETAAEMQTMVDALGVLTKVVARNC